MAQDTELRHELSDGANHFAFAAYKQIATTQHGNIFFSPFSIWTALSMASAGAEGSTLSEIQKTLGLPSDKADALAKTADLYNKLSQEKGKELIVAIANSLWSQSGSQLQKEYLALVKRYFSGELREVDFNGAAEEAKTKINSWVEDKTRGKIKDLLERRQVQNASLVLVNAVYFFGTWATQFDPKNTWDREFSNGAKKTKIPFMGQQDNFSYAENSNAMLIELPYVSESLVMNIVLPKEDRGHEALDKLATGETLAALLGKTSLEKVFVSLPKFRIVAGIPLKDTLYAMGIKAAFHYGQADFSGINGNKDFFISEVIHKAFVDVNEKGTEAAAATAMTMEAGAAPMKPPKLFIADHPFVMYIRDKKTGAILFMGRVAEPKS